MELMEVDSRPLILGDAVPLLPRAAESHFKEGVGELLGWLSIAVIFIM